MHAPPSITTIAPVLVEKHFADSGQGLLLARLGQMLRREGVNIEAELEGRKLSEFIRAKLGDRLALVAASADRKIVLAVPVGKESQQPSPATVESQRDGTIPRISPTIWAAFVRPLAKGNVRAVSISPPNFDDIAESQMGLPEYIITADDIVTRQAGSTKSEHERAVFEKITAWIGRFNISLHQITAQAVAARSNLARKSLFYQFYERLSDEQKKRTQLPLDVVEALLRG